ncbi:MAG TPA: helix-turn-helix transcriptional regulator [Silvibacterium sp.]|nr:helix-turn-helix transcriptional regulator [Silvibacterium sp.]
MPFRPDRLKALRAAKNWSQDQLTKKSGLSQSLVAKSEQGDNSPRSDALEKLAQALDCTADYLLGRGPEYKDSPHAAACMAFEVFSAQQDLTDELREKCRRVLQHREAPRTAEAWRAFAEMLAMATGPIPSTKSLPKPMAISRPLHRRG